MLYEDKTCLLRLWPLCLEACGKLHCACEPRQGQLRVDLALRGGWVMPSTRAHVPAVDFSGVGTIPGDQGTPRQPIKAEG